VEEKEVSCKSGAFKFIYTNNNRIEMSYGSQENIKYFLTVGPIPVAMAIPECNDGRLRGGGTGAIECREGVCTGNMDKFRGCSGSPMMKKYEHHDIIMSDSDTVCTKYIAT